MPRDYSKPYKHVGAQTPEPPRWPCARHGIPGCIRCEDAERRDAFANALLAQKEWDGDE